MHELLTMHVQHSRRVWLEKARFRKRKRTFGGLLHSRMLWESKIWRLKILNQVCSCECGPSATRWSNNIIYVHSSSDQYPNYWDWIESHFSWFYKASIQLFNCFFSIRELLIICLFLLNDPNFFKFNFYLIKYQSFKVLNLNSLSKYELFIL